VKLVRKEGDSRDFFLRILLQILAGNRELMAQLIRDPESNTAFLLGDKRTQDMFLNALKEYELGKQANKGSSNRSSILSLNSSSSSPLGTPRTSTPRSRSSSPSPPVSPTRPPSQLLFQTPTGPDDNTPRGNETITILVREEDDDFIEMFLSVSERNISALKAKIARELGITEAEIEKVKKAISKEREVVLRNDSHVQNLAHHDEITIVKKKNS